MRQSFEGSNAYGVATNLTKIFGALILTCALTACDQGSGSGNSDDASTNPTPTPTPTGLLSPLTFSVSTQWENQDTSTFELAKKCEVDAAAIRGSVDTCTITVEEARMYYSKIRFSVATNDPIRCRVLHFQPYWYTRSITSNFYPPGEVSATGIECNPAVEPDQSPKCFGGAATQIVPGFPKYKSLYSLTSISSTYDVDLKSEGKERFYGGAHVNYLVTNDKTTRGVAGPLNNAKSYIANSMVDYSVTCVDEWGYPYHTIDITISDEDKDGAESDAEDNFVDWD